MRHRFVYTCFVLALLAAGAGCAQQPAPPPTPAQPSVTPPISVPSTSPPPTVDFAANPREGQPPLVVVFAPAATGEISRWHWDFGDGQFSDEKMPSHTYTSNGEYTVSLAVNGSSGSNAVTKTAYVKIGSPAAVSWKEAGRYIGQNRPVEGVIVDTYYAVITKGKPTFLNFNMPYKGYFTCVIWDSDRAKFVKQFPTNPETYFINRRVVVRGLIEEYPRGSGTPEMVLREPSQIEVVGK